MTTVPTRVAIVGTTFGLIHAEAYRRDGRCQIAAICGSSTERAEQAARQCGAETAFGDWRELLADGRFDVVSLAVPPEVQVQVAVEALARGKHVFFEKPLAPSLGEAERLARLVASHGLASAIDFELPELSMWQEAKRLADAGALGDVRHVAVRWEVETYVNQHRLASWKADSARGGGALNLFTVHVLHYVTWLLGPIRRVGARLRRSADDSRPADTLNAVWLDSVSGVPISIDVATDAFARRLHRIDVFGSAATIRLENEGADYAGAFRLLMAKRGEKVLRDITPYPSTSVASSEDGRIVPVGRLVSRFIDAVRGGASCVPGVGEGLAVQQLVAAARDSDARGAFVQLTPVA